MKKLSVLIFSLSTYLSLPIVAFAAASNTFSLCVPNTATNPGFNALCNFDLRDLVGTFIPTIFILAIVVAVFYLIWGGFKWLTSGGDKAAVQAAREHIVAAIVGLVLIFVSYVVMNLIMNFFFGRGVGGTFTLPTI